MGNLPGRIDNALRGVGIGLIIAAGVAGTVGLIAAGHKLITDDRYYRLQQRAIACVEQDNVPGLSYNELTDFYKRVGIDLELTEPTFYLNLSNPGSNFTSYAEALVELPNLTTQQLERIAKSCEGERN